MLKQLSIEFLKFGNILHSATLVVVALATGLTAQADTIPVTFVGADTGVNNGADYVMPYQLSVNGLIFDATCYDVFDDVIPTQTWNANELTLAQAVSGGQFSSNPSAMAEYQKIGFLSQQATYSAQDQIDLQEDIWNVFAPGRYAVTAGMLSYNNLLTTSAFTTFDFNTVRFLEDANQGPGRAQAFVIDPPAQAPEPGTVVLMGSGFFLVAIGMMRKRMRAEGVTLNQ